jgi:hypothetical protein
MIFNAVAALCKAPVAVPLKVRTPWQALLGWRLDTGVVSAASDPLTRR